MENIVQIVSIILALSVAIIGHEIMHGAAAYRYGDSTAKNQNRLSINPLVHIDPVGTVLVPALLYFSGAPFLFGWAKPVPININIVLRNGGENGAIVVALAGIIYNFLLAIIAFIIMSFLSNPNSIIMLFINYFLIYTIVYNIILGIFNLFPIPPLDGSHALMHLLRKYKFYKFANYMQKISKYGMILLIIIIATPLSKIIFAPVKYILEFVLP